MNLGDLPPMEVGDIGPDDVEIVQFLARLTGKEPDRLAYCIIATAFDETGQMVFANTPDTDQMIALLHSVLFIMTKHYLGGPEPVEREHKE
jgi:hypothetical protein